jgi:regulator of sirC expression with transglutaminase-like and TPR domain
MNSPGAEEIEASPADYLSRLGKAGDGPHDIGLAALMLSALDHPERKLGPYVAHLAELSEAARAEAHFARDGETAAHALGRVFSRRFGYDGDRMVYDDPDNADLMMVIERRRGLPVALGILYMHAARAAKMEAHGLHAPGHFLLKVAVNGSEALIDPFAGGVAAAERERMVPHLGGHLLASEPGQSDEPGPYEPVSDIDVLLRLQNNIRNRALKNRDPGRAIEIGRRMALIAPHRPPLWLELGRLQESTGALSAARSAYEHCLKAARGGDLFHNEATLALHALRRRIN